MFRKALIIVLFVQILFSSCDNNIRNRRSQIIHGIFSPLFTLDPSKISNTVSYQIFPLLFEPLVTLDKNNNIEPKLAENWKSSEDGLSYYFHLRPNVKFHDGTYLTAEDVKISFLRQFDSKCQYYYGNPPNIFENLLKGTIRSIEIVDSLNVKFNLKHPNSLFLYLISSPRASLIISSEALKKYGKEFEKHPIGTGPFKLLYGYEDDCLLFVPFENYWGKIPNIKELKFKIGRADELETQTLENSIDVLSRISGSNIERFIDSKMFDFLATEPETIYFLVFNLNRSVLKDKKLREAILLSLDKKNIVSTLNRTNAVVAQGPLPFGIFNSENLNTQKDYDFDKAKELIKISRYDGSKLKLIGFEDTPRTRIFFDIIVNYLNQIGIEIEKNYYNEWEEFLNAREFDDFDLTLEGWGADILGDPYFFLYNLFHSDSNFNVFRYKNEKVDKLLEEAVHTFDKDKRDKLYVEINNLIIEDIPAVFISQIKDVFVVNKRIKNVIINPYRYVEYDKVVVD